MAFRAVLALTHRRPSLSDKSWYRATWASSSSFRSPLAGAPSKPTLAGRGVEVHDLGEERADLPRLIMGYSAEDARDADFDFNRVIRLLIGRSRLRAVGWDHV